MKRILFQGDSITDAGRNYEYSQNGGCGYATMVSGRLSFERPGEYEFLNRGISGNRIVDLYARIKADFINLKPDMISILIGVNDVWHEVSHQSGVDSDKFKRIYTLLIEEIKAALPKVEIMLLEPFVLRGTATEESFDFFISEVALRSEAAQKISQEFNLPFISLQEKFTNACRKAPEAYWLYDGVHPTAAGHALIAEEWIKMFDSVSK